MRSAPHAPPCPGTGTIARSAEKEFNYAERAGFYGPNVASRSSARGAERGIPEHSTILHAPAIHAVVGGDVVYNQVHMMTAETDEQGRKDWIASLDRIAAL